MKKEDNATIAIKMHDNDKHMIMRTPAMKKNHKWNEDRLST